MKKILLLLTILLVGAGSVMAQNDKAADKAAKQAEKEAKKAAEAAEQEALFEQAKQALENKDFVVEAERVEFKRGNYVYVNQNTNFVSLQDNRASIQLAFNGARSGPNGIGGITVEGNISNYELKTDKKGNIHVRMMVQGIGVSASVTLQITKGSNRCRATVTPNFNSNRVTFNGFLYPSEESNIFKGRAL